MASSILTRDAKWNSLRQFGQVDFLPMFMMFYEDVETWWKLCDIR